MPAFAASTYRFFTVVTIARQACCYMLLLLCLALPSLDTVARYGGNIALLLYPLVVLALIGCAVRLAAIPATPFAGRCYIISTSAVVAGLIAIFIVVFPMADVQVPGRGSDTDEAYDIAVDAMLAGRAPYDMLTYLGNRIHQLPGALLLASPFVLLGTSAWQNLCWVAIHAVVVIRLLGPVQGSLLFLLEFAASPVLLQQIGTGSDGVMSGLSTLLALLAFMHAWAPGQRHAVLRWLSCLLLALALSNRLNFVLGVMPAVFYVWQLRGTASALSAAAVLAMLLAMINLPFYLANPAGFAPLEGMNRIGRFDALLPHATLLLPVAAALATLAGSWWLRQRPRDAALLGLGAGQCLLVVSGAVLSSIAGGAADFSYCYYGCYFMFPLGLLAWQTLLRGVCRHRQPLNA